MCICISHAYMEPTEVRKGHQIPWSWSYRPTKFLIYKNQDGSFHVKSFQENHCTSWCPHFQHGRQKGVCWKSRELRWDNFWWTLGSQTLVGSFEALLPLQDVPGTNRVQNSPSSPSLGPTLELIGCETSVIPTFIYFFIKHPLKCPDVLQVDEALKIKHCREVVSVCPQSPWMGSTEKVVNSLPQTCSYALKKSGVGMQFSRAQTKT